MRVLVLGGTGFIGRFVLDGLHAQGHTLAVLHRGLSPAALPPGTVRLRGDRRDLPAAAGELRAFAPEVVVDMIPSSGAQGEALMSVFRGVAQRLVVIGSMDVYRTAAVLHRIDAGPLEPVPLTEASALRSTGQTYPLEQVRRLQQVFGWLDDAYDKVAVEAAVRGDPALPATVLRLPMVYGPGDPLHRLFPLLKRMDDGRTAIVFDARVAQWRSTRGYVENVAAAIVVSVNSERTAGRVYNIGESDALSELEWARRVGEAAGWSGRWVVLPTDRAPAHLQSPARLEQHWSADTSLFRAETGYAERVTPAEALRRTVEWERAHPPPEWDPGQFDYPAEDAAL